MFSDDAVGFMKLFAGRGVVLALVAALLFFEALALRALFNLLEVEVAVLVLSPSAAVFAVVVGVFDIGAADAKSFLGVDLALLAVLPAFSFSSFSFSSFSFFSAVTLLTPTAAAWEAVARADEGAEGGRDRGVTAVAALFSTTPRGVTVAEALFDAVVVVAVTVGVVLLFTSVPRPAEEILFSRASVAGAAVPTAAAAPPTLKLFAELLRCEKLPRRPPPSLSPPDTDRAEPGSCCADDEDILFIFVFVWSRCDVVMMTLDLVFSKQICVVIYKIAARV